MKMFAWAVVISHRHGDNVSVVLSRSAATEALVAYCKEWWEEVRDDPPMPDDPDELIEVYFDGVDLEFYNVVKCELDIPLSTDP